MTGEKVGDGWQRWTSASGGVSGTASVAMLGLGVTSPFLPAAEVPGPMLIGDLMAGFHPDSMIHLSVASGPELASGVWADSSWVRLGDVAHMTIPEFQELVVGPIVAASGPNISGFAVSHPLAATFNPTVWRGLSSVTEMRNPVPVVPDAYVPLKR